jgi:MoaA/NifB/PqqE/SkfB family radical SAM enzyme
MKHVTSKWPHQDSIKIEWNLGKRCNLDCAYCPAEIHDNFSPHTDINVLKNTVDQLAMLEKPVRISLTGGEPCVHPKIEEFLQYASERVSWINITTNASRKAEWYALQPINHIVFSLHFDNKTVDRMLDNIIVYSLLNHTPFHVNVMAHHEHMAEVKEATKQLDVGGIPYVVRRIRWTEKHDWFDDLKYNHEDLKWIMASEATASANVLVDGEKEMHANDVIKEHLNQFEGWSCAAGVESLMINWDGEVHRATCRVGGSLGNLYTGTFEQPKENVTCTRKWCTCAADIPLTKTKND